MASTARTMTIGTLSQRSGIKVPTIRYYESIGLLAPPQRSAGNQRLYTERHVQRLAFIRHSRDMGFPLEDIRDLLALADSPDQSCAAADSIASRHLQAVRERIAQLRILEQELEGMVETCHHDCVAQCRVLTILGDHAQCLHHRHFFAEGTGRGHDEASHG